MGKKYTTNFLEDTNGSTGSANQVLVSTSTGVDWVDGSGSGIIGGPYLPLLAGSSEILTGDLAMNNNIGIIIKDSAGAFRDVLKLNSTNILEIGSSALSTNIIFKNTGNVGIGTTSPDANLEIDGGLVPPYLLIAQHIAPVLLMKQSYNSNTGIQALLIQLVI